MSYFGLPPELNSTRMFAGAGVGTMVQAALAWQGLAQELATAAESFASVTSELTGQAWQGAAAASRTSARGWSA